MFKNFILDVDGVLNDGKIYWGVDGKPFKVFGNYDHDGLKMLRKHVNIMFISADKAGYEISHSRIVSHMGFPLFLVPEKTRMEFVSGYDLSETVYMGDGFFDAPIIKLAALGIAPQQARREAIMAADYVTPSAGGHGAVMDACLHILDIMGLPHEI